MADAKSKKGYNKGWENLKPAKKGECRNPNGRPKIPEDARAMLKAATPAAVKLLVDTLNNSNEKTETRVKCAETVLDRVYGKANQPIDFGGELPKIEIVLGEAKELAK